MVVIFSKGIQKIVREFDVKIHTHKDTEHKLDYTQFREFKQMGIKHTLYTILVPIS